MPQPRPAIPACGGGDELLLVHQIGKMMPRPIGPATVVSNRTFPSAAQRREEFPAVSPLNTRPSAVDPPLVSASKAATMRAMALTARSLVRPEGPAHESRHLHAIRTSGCRPDRGR